MLVLSVVSYQYNLYLPSCVSAIHEASCQFVPAVNAVIINVRV